MTQRQTAFGTHLMVDGYGCLRPAISSLDLVYRFLDEAPELIGMTKIMPPYVFKYVGKVPEDWGVSGFVLIAESHISIHTFPDKGFLSLDIFSCKDFEVEAAVALAVQQFGIRKVEQQVSPRGLEFPRSQEVVKEHLTRERRAWCGGGGG